MKEGDQAGLIIMGLEHAAMMVKRDAKDFALCEVVNGKERMLTHLVGTTVELKAQVKANGGVTFAHRVAGAEWQNVDGTFKAKEGRWIGAKVGLFCMSVEAPGDLGFAEFDDFRFS
jgi:hypothetical protein